MRRSPPDGVRLVPRACHDATARALFCSLLCFRRAEPWGCRPDGRLLRLPPTRPCIGLAETRRANCRMDAIARRRRAPPEPSAALVSETRRARRFCYERRAHGATPSFLVRALRGACRVSHWGLSDSACRRLCQGGRRCARGICPGGSICGAYWGGYPVIHAGRPRGRVEEGPRAPQRQRKTVGDCVQTYA